ncbi:MAG: RNA polymerase sigma factor [Chitinispirillales bacterium]|jgi:RNA polymerase sigma-70 factor (ECF subfamily)|nr:RNA polymerase sigma factor [Chitinispirillales bacterium]
MEEIDDITLERAMRGDEAAFRRLYEHYSPFVWRLCYRSSNGDDACAEEIMQNAFVKVHRYLSGFLKGSSFSTWLYSVTYHCVNEYFTKAAKHRLRNVAFDDKVGMSGTDAGGGRVPYEDRQLVERVLKSLSESDRFMLVAREVEGVPYEELAGIMGVNVGALRTRMARLKADIRERLEKQYLGE